MLSRSEHLDVLLGQASRSARLRASLESPSLREAAINADQVRRITRVWMKYGHGNFPPKGGFPVTDAVHKALQSFVEWASWQSRGAPEAERQFIDRHLWTARSPTDALLRIFMSNGLGPRIYRLRPEVKAELFMAISEAIEDAHT